MNHEHVNCKIGAVSYLNTRPLVYGLEREPSDWELSFDLPSRLARQLANGALDVALIPSIEVFQNPEYTVVSNACIACRGPVWSVKLMSRCGISQIRTLALDEGSRTSAALVRILLQKQYGLRPELRPLPIDESWQDADADAVLIIGDRAMNPLHDNQFPQTISQALRIASVHCLPVLLASIYCLPRTLCARASITSESYQVRRNPS
ncbi:MAG: menaquinone biosynthesis protein [Pirellulaceae bacterium]|nr:menaquinone biosynthesis protein [Pirellulaceae bacterium]